MSKNRRVLNITTGERPKLSQAEKRIANCTLAWVEIGKTVRNLTLAESIAARNELAKHQERLVSSELFGLKFIPPVSDTHIQEHKQNLVAALQFVRESQAL